MTEQKTFWQRYRSGLACLVLAGLTFAVFWPVGNLGFINYDDYSYVLKNGDVQAGLTWQSICWALTTTHVGNWHPLTWVSHMLDCRLFGLQAGAHHRVNLVFHVANTLLLFYLLRRATGTFWRGVFVAALFALHPMHVQSVAWVSERKDVLSAFFFFLTLLAYVRYVELKSQWVKSGSPPPVGGRLSAGFRYSSAICYLFALIFFALGLMSKPMLVTVPCVLLLLDFWPLQRFSASPLSWRVFGGLLMEKIPFGLLSLASCVVTIWVQHQAAFVVSGALLPWYVRGFNALVFCTMYLEKLVWPVHLSIFYPYAPMPLEVYLCYLVLPLALSAWACFRGRAQPYLVLGWFWFLIMLLPVIGLVQVGMQAIADRYTYLPAIGLFVALAWGMAAGADLSRRWRLGVVAVALGLAAACSAETRVQLRYWQDDITLFGRSVALNPVNNFDGYYLLADAYRVSGNWKETVRCYRAILQMFPDRENIRRELISLLMAQKQFAGARAELEQLLRMKPGVPEVMNDLAWILSTCPDPNVRDGLQAVYLAAGACQLTGFQQPVFIGTLAAAQAEAGDFNAAVNSAARARELALAQGLQEVAAKNTQLMALYQSGQAYHEPTLAPPDR